MTEKSLISTSWTSEQFDFIITLFPIIQFGPITTLAPIDTSLPILDSFEMTAVGWTIALSNSYIDFLNKVVSFAYARYGSSDTR